MSIELANAYVTIIPSLKGAARQIQSDLGGVDMSGVGSEMGQQLSNSIGGSLDLTAIGTRMQDIGRSVSGIGDSLTRYVTLPALGAVAAVGGITAALGWGRLVDLDSAQAQLRGLGYEAADVERISQQVTDAVQGGMTTMAEGTAIAAGALAAGVEEGADLERYIRLVGDAAVGANRPVAEMAQIFNRVQGQGRLMTQELNMIEMGLPGFAATMAESMGISQQEFRAMVTAGEISAEQFMGVMDTFAGGMASAYAESWRGLVANTKAWVGIVGETILEGVFQEAKTELASFQDWLKTDDVQQWARDFGQTVGEAFSRLVEFIKSAIEWWGGLDDSTKSAITRFAVFAVALGPVLAIGGRLLTVFGGIVKGVAPLVRWVGRLAGGFGGASAAGGGLLRGLLRFAGPIGLIVAAFISAWRESEAFRDSVKELGSALLDVGKAIWEVVKPVLDVVMPIVGALMGLLGDALAWVLRGVADGLRLVAAILTGDWDEAWSIVGPIVESAASLFSGAVGWVVDAAYGMAAGVGNAINDAVAWVAGLPRRALDAVVGIGNTLWNAGVELIQGFIRGIISRFAAVRETLLGLTASLVDWKGPAARDATLLTGAGESIIQSLIDGFESQFPQVRNSLSGLTDEIAGMDRPTLGVDLDMPVARRPQVAMSPVSNVPAWDGDDAAGGLGRSGRVAIDITNHYPQEEPTSVTANKALQFAAAIGLT